MKQPINILIVDDEPKNLTVLETILNDPGYRLVRAESADQALLALVAEEFALLILDIRMPDMTGFELAQMIKDRKKTARVPIIFLTAYHTEDQHILEGYEAGAVDYLHKPVNAAVLRSKVAVFAELHRKNREAVASNNALLAEITERRRAEDRLRELNETLEQRVEERTKSLRESEHFLQRITEVTPGVIHIFDVEEQRSVFINRSVASVLGYSAADVQAIGAEVVPKLMHPDDVPRFEEHLRVVSTLADGEIADFEHRMRDRAGEWHWFHSRDSVFARNNAGGVRQIIGTAIEITERKRVEAAMQNAEKRKDEFLATLAHELRNPLAPMRNAAQVLHVKGPATPELRWARDVIDRQIGQMARLIDDLMDVCRISQGKLELKRERVEFAKVVQGAIEASRPLIEQMGHNLTVTLPDHNVVLDADLTRLAQVFLNLLNNAAKYTERGGRVHLAVERQGSDVMVTVRDTGIGIPADKLPTIFEMFSQVEGALSRSQGGLGIGLCLVKRLVEMHGGSVAASSEGLGKGSEFIVRLPIVMGQTSSRKAGAEQAMPSSDLRILVVDDNRDAAESLAMLLNIMGNTVHTAHDGEEGVAAALEFQPDVVICDIGMPKMNGYEACRRMRQQACNKNMIIIAVTGWAQNDDRRKSKEAGFDYHMAKPVDPQALMTMLSGLGVVKV